MRKFIFYILLLNFVLDFTGCTSFSDTSEMKELCLSYKTFSDKTDFVYRYDFTLNKENAGVILKCVNNFIINIETYMYNTRDVVFKRLSSGKDNLDNLFRTATSLKNFLEKISNKTDISAKKEGHYFTILFNRLHKEMYDIEYNRVLRSESIISDYVKYFLIFIIFFFILCIVLLVILVFELKQRDVKIIETSKFLNYTIKGQEDEKQHIARELHDTVAQDIRYIIQLTKQLDTSEQVDNILKRQENCLKEVRELCSSFIPQDIENKDIVASLNDTFIKIKTETDMDVKLTIPDNINFKNMSNERFLNFFRIIQEILTNAQKHSKASEISVLIKREIIEEVSYINLIITDDGVGIDRRILDSINEQRIINKKHFGLKNIIQRVQLLKGEINFTSNSEFGTEISVIFPELESNE